MAGARGGKWEVSDVGTAQRGNWKSTISDTGASIEALDYTTSLTSRYAFADNGNDSVGANNLTENGSPTYVTGVYGKAVSLNGSSMYLTAASNTVHDVTTGNLYISAWIYVTSFAAAGMIAAKRDPGAATNKGYRFYYSSGAKLVAEFCDGSASVTTLTANTTLSTNTWYKVEVVYDRSGSMTIYLNGTSDGSTSISTLTASATNTQTFTVGRASDGAGIFFAGYIDHLNIHTNAPGAAQITLNYNDCHSGMKATCTVTGSGFTKDIKYTRNAENTAWVADADISNSQTFSTKTLDSTNVLQNTQMHFYNRRFYDWTDLDYLTTGGVGTETIAKGIGHGGNTLTTGASTNDTAFVHYGYDASVAHSPFEVGRKFEVYFLIRNGGGGANKLIQVGLFSSARLGQASFDSTQESISFEYDTDASANWIVRNGSGAAETSTTSSTTAGTDDTLLSIICDESTIKFYADGTLLATHSTNLPTSTTDLFPQVWIKTETTAAQTMYFLRGYGWSDHS